MSQAGKRPGARDISELKARLGLKKSKPAPKLGGVVPPPGAKVGAIPAPPGAEPPMPEIPDATEDPFGAMNAMAAHAAQTAGPQYVVVNDGQPAEGVEGKMGIRVAKIAGMILVPLVIGMLVGKIGGGAASYNKTIEDASKIRDDLKKLGKSLVAVQQVLQVGKEKTGKFKINDGELTKELSAIELVYPEPEIAYKSNLTNMSHELVTDLLTVYSETFALHKEIRKHLEMTKASDKAIKAGDAKMGKFNPFKYAAHFQVPTAEEAQQGKTITFRMVELGLPLCGDTKPNPAGCGGQQPTGFQFRTDSLGNWGTKNLATPDVIANKLVLFDPNTKVMQQIVKGGEASTAEVAYTQRIMAIEERLDILIELRKNVEQRLNNKSNESTKFTFFM